MATIEARRYKNRKVYTTEHGYLNLVQIIGHLRDGHGLRVLEHQTGKDVTAQTLAHVIVDDLARGAWYDVSRLAEVVRGALPPVAKKSGGAR